MKKIQVMSTLLNPAESSLSFGYRRQRAEHPRKMMVSNLRAWGPDWRKMRNWIIPLPWAGVKAGSLTMRVLVFTFDFPGRGTITFRA